MDREQRGLTGWIRRHPITAFFVWFFTVGQALAFIPLFVDVPVAQQWFINAATVIGLLLPAVVITAIVDGREGVRALGRRIAMVRAAPALYAIGFVVLPLLVFALALVLLGAPGVPTSTVVSAIGGGLLVNTVVGFVLNNLWEEVAWMGFVQARLQERHGALLAAVIAAPLFALQHVTLYLGGGAAMAVVLFLFFTVVVLPFRAFQAWLYNRSGGSLFLVGLVHAFGNALTVGAGFTTGYLRILYPDDAQLVGFLHVAAFGVLGLIAIAATRGRLGLPAGRARGARVEPGLATTAVH